MQKANERPGGAANPLVSLVHDLTEASAWAETAIQGWLRDVLPWPVEPEAASLLATQAELPVQGKERWEGLTDQFVTRRLNPQPRDDFQNCTGLRLQMAASLGDLHHLREADGDVRLGRTYLVPLVQALRPF